MDLWQMQCLDIKRRIEKLPPDIRYAFLKGLLDAATKAPIPDQYTGANIVRLQDYARKR